MGSCFGKPSNKGGHVLGGSSSAAPPNRPANTNANKGKANATSNNAVANSSQGNTLGSSPSSTTPRNGELSASALAAQKRAEAAELRGVQKGGGQLAKKLADTKKANPFEVQAPVPEPTNTQWN